METPGSIGVGSARADGEQIVLNLDKPAVGLVVEPVGSRVPIVAFNSSTVPYASTRGSSLPNRSGPSRPVVPSSPVLV